MSGADAPADARAGHAQPQRRTLRSAARRHALGRDAGTNEGSKKQFILFIQNDFQLKKMPFFKEHLSRGKLYDGCIFLKWHFILVFLPLSVYMFLELWSQDALSLSLGEGGPITLSLVSATKEMSSLGKSGVYSPSHLFGQVCRRSPHFRGGQQQGRETGNRTAMDDRSCACGDI